MMTASERLRETQKAAGHRNLNTWHDVLIKEGKTCKAAQVVRLGGRSHKTNECMLKRGWMTCRK